MHESWPKFSQRNAKDWRSEAQNGRLSRLPLEVGTGWVTLSHCFDG
jgi:hypothetical protein